MSTMSPTESAPFAEGAFPVMRCRRYLFDRADFQDDPRAPLGAPAAPDRSTLSPSPIGADGGLEREQ
ncbi:hypothetical protein LJR219_002783 [Phenylobacterium sp. LjRoot219]|uniref:hypothetical protein n=1 Tax=Phenylobacterium sp. LjRoot219 TaxID=3342283 RepID=UPI003ECC5C69